MNWSGEEQRNKNSSHSGTAEQWNSRTVEQQNNVTCWGEINMDQKRQRHKSSHQVRLITLAVTPPLTRLPQKKQENHMTLGLQWWCQKQWLWSNISLLHWLNRPLEGNILSLSINKTNKKLHWRVGSPTSETCRQFRCRGSITYSIYVYIDQVYIFIYIYISMLFLFATEWRGEKTNITVKQNINKTKPINSQWSGSLELSLKRLCFSFPFAYHVK